MKNYTILFIVSCMLYITACMKKDLDIPYQAAAIKIVAVVPQLIYSNYKSVELDASPTLSANGSRKLDFLWSCTSYPAGHIPTIVNNAKALTDPEKLRGKVTNVKVKFL